MKFLTFSLVNNERMKRWNGIKMGFRKNDEKEQERRDLRANDIALEYANKKGLTPTVMMGSELHQIGMSVALNCATCIESGLDHRDALLMIAHHSNPMEDKRWFENPILNVECIRGHEGHIKLNTLFHTGKYPVHLRFLNGGIAWLEEGITIGKISYLREQGRWPYSDDDPSMGVMN